MDSHVGGGAFSAQTITKYFKDQKPPTNDEGNKWVDDVFPPTMNSILSKYDNGEYIDKEQGEKRAAEIDSNGLVWKRIDDIFGESLIFEQSIVFDDIKQGSLGNCYFLSALSALTEMPNLIYQIFRTKQKNNFGYFEVVMFIDGEWQIVPIDDYFVCKKENEEFKFAKPNGRELWAIILEKAWAKVNGGYANTISGNPSDALMAITGFSVERFFHDKIDKEKLWNVVVKAEQSDNIMCTSTSAGEETINAGLVENHAYTLISAKVGNFDGEEIRMLKIRNPWGNKEWKGDYSDLSDLWTPEKRDFFGMDVTKDDGCFCIRFEDFIKYFTDTNVCYVMYDCNVKNFYINGEVMAKPHVYSIYIDKKSKFTVSAIFRHWRFNRDARNDSHPTTIMMARYNEEREIYEVTGEFSAKFNVELVRELDRGLYCFWFYCNYEDTVSPKPERYIIRFAGTSDFRYRYCGEDYHFLLLKEIFRSALYNKFKDEIEAKDGYQFDNIDNTFENSGIGYLYVKCINKSICQKWTSDASEMVAFKLFPPFTDKKEFSFLVKKDGGDFVVLGMRQKQYGTYWFNLSSTFSTYPAAAQDQLLEEKNVARLENVNYNVLLPKSTKRDYVNKDYYDYHSSSLKESKTLMEFDSIDVSKVEFEELKVEYPEFMAEVVKIAQRDDFNETDLTWSKYDYGEGNGVYVGQFKNRVTRHGRGMYKWDDGEFYVGYWSDGKKDVWGRFVSAQGKVTYEGEMRDGEKNGKGKSYFSNGDFYEGEFDNGFRHGKGVYNWNSGTKWDGVCVKGRLHGDGTYYDAEGNSSPLTFENGNIIQ